MQNARVAALLVLTLAAGCDATTAREPPAQTAAARSAPAASAPAVPAAVPNAAAQAPPTPPSPSATSGASSATALGAASAAPSVMPSRTTPCHVALVGDSLTDFRVHGGGYVRELEARCPQSQFENFAKGGAMVNQMRRSFEASVVPEPYGTFTHVVVFGGVNDLYSDETAGRTTPKIEADLAAIYAEAKARGARIVALTVAPWGGFTRYFTPHRADTTRELNAWILAQPGAGAVDVTVDTHDLLTCGDPDRLCPRYENVHSDGLHFGHAGHEALGAALYAAEFHACP
jgi:lysophospholipase L1-like esterase